MLSLVGYFTSDSFSQHLLVPSAMKIATCRGLLRWLAGGWLTTGSGPSAAWQLPETARLRVDGMCTALQTQCHVGATTYIELGVAECPNGGRGPCARTTKASRFTVSIILVVIATVKERRVVAMMLLGTNATSVAILIRHWIGSATTVLVVTFTFALMARRNCRER